MTALAVILALLCPPLATMIGRPRTGARPRAGAGSAEKVRLRAGRSLAHAHSRGTRRFLVVAIAVSSFLFGVSGIGPLLFLPIIAPGHGLAEWTLALLVTWGGGGVVGAAVIGRPLDRFGPFGFIGLPAVALVVAFVALWQSHSPIVWLIATAVWGAAGWAAVPILQQAMIGERFGPAVREVAWQMAAMYFGAAAGSAIGSALLAAASSPLDLIGSAVLPAIVAGALVTLVSKIERGAWLFGGAR